jgi:hypothetical protein
MSSHDDSSTLAVAIVVPDHEDMSSHYDDASIPVARVAGPAPPKSGTIATVLKMFAVIAVVTMITTFSFLFTSGGTSSSDSSPTYSFTQRPSILWAFTCEDGMLEHLEYMRYQGWSSLECYEYRGTIPTQIGLYSSLKSIVYVQTATL